MTTTWLDDGSTGRRRSNTNKPRTQQAYKELVMSLKLQIKETYNRKAKTYDGTRVV